MKLPEGWTYNHRDVPILFLTVMGVVIPHATASYSTSIIPSDRSPIWSNAEEKRFSLFSVQLGQLSTT